MKFIAVLANMFAMPGAGTLVLGDYRLAVMQVGLVILGGLTLMSINLIGPFALTGFLFILCAWVWGIVSAIRS